MEAIKKPFDIYLPATAQRDAVKVETIQIDVVTDGRQEVITPESSALIDKKQSEAINRLATALQHQI